MWLAPEASGLLCSESEAFNRIKNTLMHTQRRRVTLVDIYTLKNKTKRVFQTIPFFPLSLSLSPSSLSERAPQSDNNPTDGSHLLRLSNQNLRISWVTARALATVPSVSEADEGSLVKLRQSTQAWRPELSEREWWFSLSLSLTHTHLLPPSPWRLSPSSSTSNTHLRQHLE